MPTKRRTNFVCTIRHSRSLTIDGHKCVLRSVNWLTRECVLEVDGDYVRCYLDTVARLPVVDCTIKPYKFDAARLEVTFLFRAPPTVLYTELP